MASIRSSVLVSLAQKNATLLITLISTVVMARLLTPKEFGIFGVAYAIVGLSASIREFGISDYIIKEKEVTRRTLGVTFGINLIVGWTLGLLILIASPHIGRLYDEPTVTEIVQVLTITVFLVPFGVTTRAMLRRNLQFGRISVINLSGAISATGIAITLGILGNGPMSLAIGSVSGTAVALLVTAIVGNPHYVWPTLRGTKSVLAFGGMTSTLNLLSTIAEQLPTILLGRTLGFDAVGIFERAKRALSPFQTVVIKGVLPVALPAFSLASRSGSSITGSYLTACQYLTVVAWPFFVLLIFMAEPLVTIVLGQRWLEATPIIRVLAIGGFFLPFISLNRPTYVAIGKLDTLFRIQIVGQPIKMLIVGLACLHSLAAVAVTLASFTLIMHIVTQRSLANALSVNFKNLIINLQKSAAVTLICSVAPLAVVIAIPTHDQPIVAFFASLCGSVCLWILALFAFRHPFSVEVTNLLDTTRRSLGSTRFFERYA